MFDLCKFTNKEIIKIYKQGIVNILDYNYLLSKFGFNEIKVPGLNMLEVLKKEILYNPIFYYIVRIP